jgi:hypothetical protein
MGVRYGENFPTYSTTSMTPVTPFQPPQFTLLTHVNQVRNARGGVVTTNSASKSVSHSAQTVFQVEI